MSNPRASAFLAGLLFLPAGRAGGQTLESLRGLAAASGPSVPPPPDKIAGAGVRRARPAWLELRGAGAGFDSAAEKILAGLALLGTTPTGRPFAPLLEVDGAKVRIEENGSLQVYDGENAVIAGPDFVEEKTDWQMAVFMAHELEHIRQRKLGLTGLGARGARELGAFLVQNRVWIELGGAVHAEHWESNLSNSQDMWAWLEYPWTAMTALALRSELELDLANDGLRGYWEDLLAGEAAWRGQWSGRFPQGKDGKAAALFVLEQAARFGAAEASGKVSPWLPETLERAARLGPGESLALPGEASDKDRALLAAFPGGLELSGAGRNAVRRRPSEP